MDVLLAADGMPLVELERGGGSTGPVEPRVAVDLAAST